MQKEYGCSCEGSEMKEELHSTVRRGIVHTALCPICGKRYKLVLKKKVDITGSNDMYWPMDQCGAHLSPSKVVLKEKHKR